MSRHAWRVNLDGDWPIVETEDGSRVAWPDGHDMNSMAEVEYRAELIGASPRMLGLLRRVLENVHGDYEHEELWNEIREVVAELHRTEIHGEPVVEAGERF